MIYMSILICIRYIIYIYAYIYIYMLYIIVHTIIYNVRIIMSLCTCMYVHTYMHACKYVCMHAYIIYIYIYRWYIHTYTYNYTIPDAYNRHTCLSTCTDLHRRMPRGAACCIMFRPFLLDYAIVPLFYVVLCCFMLFFFGLKTRSKLRASTDSSDRHIWNDGNGETEIAISCAPLNELNAMLRLKRWCYGQQSVTKL